MRNDKNDDDDDDYDDGDYKNGGITFVKIHLFCPDYEVRLWARLMFYKLWRN
jgi:hypothetical protein